MGIWAEGTMPDSALGREDAGDASTPAGVHFPNILLWGMAPPMWSLLTSPPAVFPPGIPEKPQPRSRSGSRRERMPPPAPGTSPRGFIHPRGSADREMLIQDFLGRWTSPKNPAHIQLHPSSLEGGTGSHSPEQDFLSPSNIDSNSPVELR